MTAIEQILQQSNELDEAISKLLEGASYPDSTRSFATVTMCDIALEHAHSLRLLTGFGNQTSAVSLIRLQFEALTRAIWLLYAASDVAVAKLMTKLTKETEQEAANSLPTVGKMFDQISKRAPPEAVQMLSEYKEMSWKATNSFVHSGIHAIQRHSEGYPEALIINVIQNSNGLSTMTGMILANLCGEARVTKPMSKIQQGFKDCLPPLVY